MPVRTTKVVNVDYHGNSLRDEKGILSHVGQKLGWDADGRPPGCTYACYGYHVDGRQPNATYPGVEVRIKYNPDYQRITSQDECIDFFDKNI